MCKYSKTHLFLEFPFSWVSLPFNTQNSHTQNFGSNIPNLSLQNHNDKLPNPLKPFIISNASNLYILTSNPTIVQILFIQWRFKREKIDFCWEHFSLQQSQ
jgi:hypothetical protein